jgi:phosphomannomutase
MTLIKSISGIRGTIGGAPKLNLTPIDTVKFAAAYGTMLLQNTSNRKIVIGRDGRISGSMVSQLVSNTLIGLGFTVIDLGLSTTPTVEMAVVFEAAAGGIILTASHNPKQWNALKLLNNKGEFISAAEGKAMLEIAEKEAFTFAEVDALGTIINDNSNLQKHIDAVVNYPLVNKNAIASANFNIVIDAINSSGAIAVPQLLQALGVTNYTVLHADMHGNFAHNPEPLKEHLTDLSTTVVAQNATLGIAVDPDVDRLCFVCEDGTMFGEEYTLVAVADYVLSQRKGNTVSNMSSTLALRDVTLQHGAQYQASAVGEVNVVATMKEINAVIGGEGNGGIIVPDLHYGRDALIGIALFLTHLANTQKTVSALRASYPQYFMSKNKIEVTATTDFTAIKNALKQQYSANESSEIDGLKIYFDGAWVHLRTSNTEPIIRIYTESKTQQAADLLAQEFVNNIKALM